MRYILKLELSDAISTRNEQQKKSSLERDTDGRITINIQESTPDQSNRRLRSKMQFFQASASPKRNRQETEMRVQRPLKGFIGSAYEEKDRTGLNTIVFK